MNFINELEFSDLTDKKIETKKPKEIVNEYKIIPENERVRIYNELILDYVQFEDFTEELYPYSLNFYDFEVFQYDWCVTIINPILNIRTVIVNNSKALKQYYEEHKNEIWVGYNSRNYDVFILKSILLGLNPKKTSDDLILREMKGYQICEDFKKIYFLNFDIYTKHSLKVIEGFLGNNIQESGVDFNINRLLTDEEIKQTLVYNNYDVMQTIEVFRKNKELYNSHIQLIETFNLDLKMIGLTQAQLTANILECEKTERNDEFNFKLLDVIKLRKYNHIYDWFNDYNNRDYKKTLCVDVCGIPHSFGWGGVHGAPTETVHEKGKIYHVDVVSYYPSLMIKYDLLSRNSKNKSKYKTIYDTRVALKKAGKKKEQAPYKIVLNGTYGISKDKYSSAYDPQMANAVCVNGQLLLLDLLEKIEPYITLIQSNTDGIIVKVNSDEETEKIKNIAKRWELRSGMNLEWDEIDEIFQKDVNNYIVKFANGKIERKGAYVMELDDLNYDLPIVNKAIVSYIVDNIPIRQTIEDCNSFRDFQKILKVSSHYQFAWHNNKKLNGKVFRVFASSNYADTYIGKCKFEGATIEKFANTPEHCFIFNDSVNDLSIPKKLNREWYITLAEKRVEDFGLVYNNLFNL